MNTDTRLGAKLAESFGKCDECRCPHKTSFDNKLKFKVRELLSEKFECYPSGDECWDMSREGRDLVKERNEYLKNIGLNIPECMIPDDVASKVFSSV